MTHQSEFTGCGIETINDDAIVPTVGAINEFPVWVKMYIRAGIIARKTGRQGRKRI